MYTHTHNHTHIQLGCITSPALVHALFDIYVGTNAVSPKTKESFGRSLYMLANA